MKYDIEALTCPNCGAPLDVKPGEDITFCLYCNSTIHIGKHEETGEHQETGEHKVTHMQIPPEVISEIKQLVLSGKKEEAIEKYQKAANVGKPEAEKFVDFLLSRLTNVLILNRPLSAKGYLICSLFLVILIATIYALVSGAAKDTLLNTVCWVLLFASAFNLLALNRPIITTIKYLPIKWTKATILKFQFINQKKKYSFFKVLLDVKKPDGTSFRSETNIMIKTENAAKLQEGKTIDVKYRGKEKIEILASVSNL